MPLDCWYGIHKDSDLKRLFVDPPKEFSLLPFWAWNDTLDEDTLRFQIDEMLNKGVYGAFLHARSGIEGSKTPYFSEGWWKAVKAVVEYGAEKGFFAALYDEDKWPSGSAGGRVVSSNREYSKRGLKVEKWEISGPRTLALDFSGDIVAVLAGRLINRQSLDPNSILDITDMANYDWQVPEGRWSVMCFSELRDTGIQIDYLNRETVAQFIQMTHEEYFRRFGTYFGTTIPGIFFDEIYANLKETELVWSRDFLREFETRKGYDLRSYLPYLLYNVGEETPRIRCDYFDVFAALYTEAWFEQIAHWCEDHRIWMTGHTLETIRDYQNQGSYFATWGPVQIPGTDNEDYRYSFPRRVRWYKAKQLSSLVHLKGKKRAMVEAVGGGGWVVPLFEYKIGLALLGAYGLNMFVPHLFHYSVEKPECMDDWPPSWFYRNPYWKYFKKLADFSRRISFIGTIGSHVCDVCLLYPITSLWADGMDEKEDVGTLGGGERGDILETQYNAVQEILLDNMIDYDIVDPEAVICSEVSDKRLQIADEHYSVLILPPLTTIKRDVASKIRTFFNNGGTVVALNQLPKNSMEKGENDGYVMNIFMQIFGFDPRTVRIGYLETDKNYEQEYILCTNAKGGKAYFTKGVNQIPQIISNCIDKDVEVVRGDGSGLRILHRSVATGECYLLVNEKKLSKNITLSFRDGGKPELWDPETGEIRPITNYSWVNGKLTIPLYLKPWDACYIVCTPTDSRAPEVMLSRTNLQDTVIVNRDGDKIALRGWRRGDVKTIHLELERTVNGNREVVANRVERYDSSEPIQLGGNWNFIPAPKVLDEQWKSGISSSIIELPVMRFRPERNGDNGELLGWTDPDFDSSDWKRIKVKDTCSPHKACKRYLSSWDGAWINYYSYDRHWGTLGGKAVSFRRRLNLGKDVASGWVCVTADKPHTFYLNQEVVGSGSNWKDPQVYQITSHLNKGENVFLIKVEQCQGLLLQGEIEFTDGSKVRLISDHQWETSIDDGIWCPAFPYVYPPLGPWGEVPVPGNEVTFPVILWYRQSLPVGARALKRPAISGKYKMFVNSHEVGFSTGSDEVDISGYLREGTNILSVKVVAEDYDDGILEPLPVVCGTGTVSLASWTEQGLSWYSGRAVYSREFDLPDSYQDPEIKLMLELGEVRYCAEIWVNDELVTYRPWPPFSADITSHVRVGKNKVSIVVANLLANQRRWDIYDQNLTDLRSRFNHEGAVLRESDCLESGLLGPVRIIPYYHETVEVELES
ncbi:MAG: hypothetical protein JSU77_09595 [Fidelibacterota bacterium]|nr:MAG: hypothetical protein JSU77_09595 [Candidatus Neomarinimicrobiota bacterium]